MAGKKFAAEFALRRNVSAQDKILIQDSDDDVVKYAYPPQIASLSGYAYAQSVADLPLLPTNKSIGYIVGQMLYIYVGMGGDTKDGLYQSVGFFVGPQGVQGEKGEKGERGEQGVQGPKGDNGGLSLQEIDVYLAKKQYVTGDTLADMLADYVSNTSLMRDYVTIAKTQDVTGVKNFTAGVQFGGLPMYKSKDDTVYLDANLVVRGAVTMYGMNTTTSPSIFSTLPIDGKTIGRNERGELYVIGGTSGDGGGTGGGISIADVEYYLTTNGYATQDWVTGKGYITSSALEPYAPKTSIPTNTNQLTNGAGYITGITSAMVTNALGYTPLSTAGDTITATGRRQLSLQSSTDAQAALWLGTGLEQFSKCGFLQYDDSNGSIALVNFSAMANSYTGLAGLFIKRDNRITVGDANLSVEYDVLHSGNYSDYALPLTGGTIDGSLHIGGSLYPTNIKYYGSGKVIWHNDENHYFIDCPNGVLTYQAYSGHSFLGGNVAIGGTSASEKLHVHGNILASGGITCRDNFRTNDNYYGFSVKSQGGEDNWYGVKTYMQFDEGTTMGVCRIGTAYRHQGLAISFSTGNAYNYNIPSDYTYTDAMLLDKNGNLKIAGAITMYYSSDRRLKQNIRKVDASKTLMSLGGVYQYEYIDSEVQKNSTYGGSHFGLIYQNVKGTALDKMCFEREDGMGTLNYLDTNFISLIAGATMENCTEVEKLKKEIKALRREVGLLKQRVA